MADSRKALVTGGAGFIGSHVVNRLLSEGYQVAVIDDLSAGKLRNLNPAATFHHSDITRESVMDIFQREQPDLVFHLAARVSVASSTKDPVDDAEVNVIGTLRLLDASRRLGIDKFIFSSTGGAIYGNPEVKLCTEDSLPGPISPYGLSKCLAEQYVELFHRLYRLNYTILRYGNVYGPRQDPHGEAGVIAIFAQTMLEGRQPLIFGDGDQERDFIYVADVVESNIQAINRGDNRTYNIGTGEGISINHIFESLKSCLHYRWEPEHRPRRPGEVHKISLECSRALQELGWRPQTSLEEGLQHTVEYFREHEEPGSQATSGSTTRR